MSKVLSDARFKRWQEIACDVEQEHNPDKIRALARELNEAMLIEERQKAQRKTRCAENGSRCILIAVAEALSS